MLSHFNKACTLSAVIFLVSILPGCSALEPVHEGKWTFSGTVKNEQGKPIPNAWVKVRGWETLTGADGRWIQEQIISCGALADHIDNYEENDAVLIMAKGYDASEEKFIVRHPAFFQSCDPEKKLAFNTVLTKESSAKSKRPTITDSNDSTDSPDLNEPKSSPSEPNPSASRKGSVTL